MRTWRRWILWFGALQTATGVVASTALFWQGSGRGAADIGVLGLTLILLVAAAALFLGRHQDRRTTWLGGAYLLSASAFAQRSISLVWGEPLTFGSLPWLMTAVRAEVFLPYFACGFFRRFPRTVAYSPALALSRGAQRFAAYWGGILFVVSIPLSATQALVPDLALEWPFTWMRREGLLYWPPLLIALGVGFVGSIRRAARAPLDERRRVKWLLAGVALAVVPLLTVNALAYAVPPLFAYVSTPVGLTRLVVAVYPALALAPIVVLYAVLVHRALNVRLAIRKAVQYALARASLVGVAALPFVYAGFYLVANRDRTVADLLSGSSLLVFVGTLAFGLALLRFGASIRQWVDRLFFREEYDARRTLIDLVHSIRDSADLETMAGLLGNEVVRVFHPVAYDLMVSDEQRTRFAPGDPAHAPLEIASGLATALAEAGDPLEIDWERPSQLLTSLHPDDVDWLIDGGYRLLIPVRGSRGDLLGLLALGERRSELPYTTEDQKLLTAIASSVGLALENRRLRSGAAAAPDRLRAARVCSSCRAILHPDTGACHCGGDTHEARVPKVVAAKYEVLTEIGRGGMGVVYHGLDTILDREVAMKSLPRMSPRESGRLRREARVMASVSHPALEIIFAVESWSGAPILVLEYLGGGTLSDKIGRPPVAWEKILSWGVILAEGLATLHAAGILHRDVKPANIGFTAAGQPKLMDFGLARMLDASRAGQHAVDPLEHGSGRTFAGTVQYLAPEAILGKPPGPSDDVWALCVTLCEALCNVNPFEAPTREATLSAILSGQVGDVRRHREDAPSAVSRFFTDALSRDTSQRPRNAGDLKTRLAHLTSGSSDAFSHFQ